MTHDLKPKLICLAIGAVLALILFQLIPFAPEIGLGGRILMIVFGWLFLSFGLWTMRDLIALGRDLSAPRPVRAATQESARVAEQAGFTAATPDIPPARQDDIRHVVAALASHGVFAPQVPDAALLFAGTPDFGGGATPEGIFGALSELHYYHPDVDDAAFFGNLVLHPSHAEQNADTIAEQIADFEQLTGGGLAITTTRIAWPADDALATQDVVVELMIAGEPVTLHWRSAAKYLSTTLHTAIALRYQALNRGDAIATYWTDRGVWLMRLRDGAAQALNSELKLDDTMHDLFGWLHNDTPMESGRP